MGLSCFISGSLEKRKCAVYIFYTQHLFFPKANPTIRRIDHPSHIADFREIGKIQQSSNMATAAFGFLLMHRFKRIHNLFKLTSQIIICPKAIKLLFNR